MADTLAVRSARTVLRASLLASLLGGCASSPSATTSSAERRDDRSSHVTAQAAARRDAGRDETTAVAKWPAEWAMGPADDEAQVFHEAPRFQAASGGAAVTIDFEDIPPGANLDDYELPGLEIICPHAPPIVVRCGDTYLPDGYENLRVGAAYHLVATTGVNVLSPGGAKLAPGPDPSIENDDVILRFNPPVSAVGFDVLSTSRDGMSFTDVTVVSNTGVVLYRGRVSIGHAPADSALPFPPAGADFWGYVADGPCIGEVRLDEMDDDAVCPDANIGLDSIRMAPPPAALACDVNGDGVVAGDDVCAVVRFWLAASIPSATATGDINRDGRVDVDDLLLVLAGFGR